VRREEIRALRPALALIVLASVLSLSGIDVELISIAGK
jgi:hypothetical protein